MTVKLTAPVIEYVLGDPDDEASWQGLQVQTLNVDQLAYERQAAKSGWKGMDAAPFQWLTFMAWHATKRREGHSYTLEDWPCLSVSAETDASPDPTQPDTV